MERLMKAWQYIISLLFVSVSLWVSASTALAETQDLHIQIDRGEMAATLENASLKLVLDEIKRQTGIHYVLSSEEAYKKISVRFQPLPVDRALRRLLSQWNYVAMFSADGNLLQVFIISKDNSSEHVVTQKTLHLEAGPMAVEPSSGETMKITSAPESEAIVIEASSVETMSITMPPDVEAMGMGPGSSWR